MSEEEIGVFDGKFIHKKCQSGFVAAIPTIQKHGDYAVCARCGWAIPGNEFELRAKLYQKEMFAERPDLIDPTYKF
jgi:hypothetical protein